MKLTIDGKTVDHTIYAHDLFTLDDDHLKELARKAEIGLDLTANQVEIASIALKTTPRNAELAEASWPGKDKTDMSEVANQPPPKHDLSGAVAEANDIPNSALGHEKVTHLEQVDQTKDAAVVNDAKPKDSATPVGPKTTNKPVTAAAS